ncbi:MAG: B12-binding domain-containing radical SAM protein [Candidatus Woesearchaeota archaeon]
MINKNSDKKKDVLFVYPPFCTPASPPYSITNLYSKIKANSNLVIGALDLNVLFHAQFFPKYKDYFKKTNTSWGDYKEVSTRAREDFNNLYSKNNKLVVGGLLPDGFDLMFNHILLSNPKIVAFSIVYSSQVFYAFALIKKLKERGIKTIVGGPAVSLPLKKESDLFFSDEVALFNYLNISIKKEAYLDFSIYPLSNYFTPDIVLPLKTSSTCYYKRCAFCSHFSNKKYEEFSLEFIEDTIKNSGSKYFFLIDDMIHSGRLIDLAKIFKKYGCTWACQLKPTGDFTKEVLSELKASGLKFVMWGVESGSNRILNLMSKATKSEDVSLILKNSKESGIINTVYIMFGFPGESKDEFLQTLAFLKDNAGNIDLVLSSVFGLQKGSLVYANPDKYSVMDIVEEKRTLLDPKISFSTSSGISTNEAFKLRKAHLKSLDKINKFPRKTNFFREHMFFY